MIERTTLEVGTLKKEVLKYMHKDIHISKTQGVEKEEPANIFIRRSWPLRTSCITRYPGGQNIY